jgi:hypothetical protein
MSKRKSDGQKARLKLRRELSRQRFSINNTVECRTLRKSARLQIARDSAIRKWIYPWIMAPTGRLRHSYPEASLLGLPTEMRQRILYEAFDMRELRDMVEHTENKGEKAAARAQARAHRVRQRREAFLGVAMSQFESDSITMLHQRIADFCCVSHVLHTDMEYVGKLWKKDLEKSLKWQFSAPLKLHKAAIVEPAHIPKRRKGKTAKVKGPGKHARRPPKCWRCQERHYDRDPICPMARSEPERWKQLTKKIKEEWEDELQPCSLFIGTKIVFADD